MIELGHMYGESGEGGDSKLAHYVRERLPENYLLEPSDLLWLDVCDSFLKGPITNESVVNATKAALEVRVGSHQDPFELLVDAQICDSNCQPLP
jgi:hypothetical protein